MKIMEFSSIGKGAPLHLADRAPGPLAPGMVRLRTDWVGVNFVDIYQRNGLYPLGPVPGVEAVGRIEAIGEGVEGLCPGQRVATAGLPAGAYAERRDLPAGRLVPVPDTIASRDLAGSFLRGLTAAMLIEAVLPDPAGRTILVHAAAGGLGLILTGWLKQRGATVIGTVSSPEKAEIARAEGLDHAILYRQRDFRAELHEITGGRGVAAVIDGVGGETLLKSLEVVAPFGRVANVGQSGGDLPVIDPALLTNRFFIRPSVLAWLAEDAVLHRAAAAWFTRMAETTPGDGHDYAFAAAERALDDLEAGRTSGPVRLRLDG